MIMRFALIISVLLLTTSCGQMPPKTFRLDSDELVNDQNFAEVCGDRSEIPSFFMFDWISAHPIAVDGRLAPTFNKEERDIWGQRYMSRVEPYCLEIPKGNHKITILVMWEYGLGMHIADIFYTGECIVSTEADHSYLVEPKRSGRKWFDGKYLDDVAVHISEKQHKELVGVCEMSRIQEDDVFQLVDDLKESER